MAPPLFVPLADRVGLCLLAPPPAPPAAQPAPSAAPPAAQPAQPVQPAQPAQPAQQQEQQPTSRLDRVKAVMGSFLSWLGATISSATLVLGKVIAKASLAAQPLSMLASSIVSDHLAPFQPTIAFAARECTNKALDLFPLLSIGGIEINSCLKWQIAERASGFIWLKWHLVVTGISFSFIFSCLFFWFLYSECNQSFLLKRFF